MVMTALECAVCGDQGPRIRVAVVHWWNNDAWEAVPRCQDRAACASRVRTAGQAWPLVEHDDGILAIVAPAPAPPPDDDDDPRAWW